MSFTDKNIYELLPSVYRLRDAEQGGPLKALMEIIAREAKVTEDNIAQLYKNWFIETCEEWVVPYIGDLLGVRGLHSITGSRAISQRAYVANTLGYRRRKGIAPVLEQLSLDTAGWPAHVTEFFELLATTQYMNHIRLHRTVTPDLRRMNQLDLLNGAFDPMAHSADFRPVSSGQARHNIPNIGLFIWRIQHYPVVRSVARRVACPDSPSAHFFTFSPMGTDTQLFNRPATETGITHISEEINVPALLRPRALFDELEARRQAGADGAAPVYQYFDNQFLLEGDPSSQKHAVFEIFPEDRDTPVPPEEILICHLENCCLPPANRIYKKLNSEGDRWEEVPMRITVAVDPVRGRFIFTDPLITRAEVSYAYGFSGDIGSGTYNRQDAIPDIFQQRGIWQVGVSKTKESAGSEQIFATMEEAIDAWHRQSESRLGVIAIMDNQSYTIDRKIGIAENRQLLIIAADWPLRDDPDDPVAGKKRWAGDLAAGGLRPYLSGNLQVEGLADLAEKTGGGLTLNGLLVEGQVEVLTGNLGDLALAHCTLLPGKGGVVVGESIPDSDTASNQWLTIQLYRTVTGPINLHTTAVVSLEIEGCIIDNRGRNRKPALEAGHAPVTFQTTTVFGDVHVKTLQASNCIFTGVVQAERRQTGCVRFCFVPEADSKTPRQFRCQPALEINTRMAEAEKSGPLTASGRETIRQEVSAWLSPGFTSMDNHHYGYAQLNQNCPLQITTGAEDGSEMGAFSYLKQPQRAANLRIALGEYLPLGLEAGIIYVT